jgi:hypothetical protein
LQVIDDAGRFLDQWGAEAERLQWTAEDLFKKPTMMKGANEDCGLCWAISGRNVVLFKASSVTFSDAVAWQRPNTKVSASKEAIK